MTPTTEPRQFVSGETLTWEISLPDYPPSDGWVLSYAFRGPGPGFDVGAIDDGQVYRVVVTSATTGALVPGLFYWQATVTLGSEVHIVREGQTLVKPGIASVDIDDTLDQRSQAKKILDAIDSMMMGKIPSDVDEYTIGTRQLRHIPVRELIDLRKYYAQLYSSELAAARAKQGGSFIQNVGIKFGRPR